MSSSRRPVSRRLGTIAHQGQRPDVSGATERSSVNDETPIDTMLDLFPEKWLRQNDRMIRKTAGETGSY